MNYEQTRTRFESLLLPLMNDAYNLARWLMRNQEDAENMVQESYLRAFRFFTSFHEGSNCRAWFLRIVRNACYTALGARDLKQKQVPLDSEADEIEGRSPLPPVSLSKKATAEAVREAIAALPVDFREVVVLRELQGLSYKEISEVSGVPLGTVMPRLARARHQLYLMLKASEDIDRELHNTGAQPSKAATLPVHAAGRTGAKRPGSDIGSAGSVATLQVPRDRLAGCSSWVRGDALSVPTDSENPCHPFT